MIAFSYVPVSVVPEVAGLLLVVAVLAAIYWTGERVPVPGERFLVALIVAIALGSAVARADVILQFCTEAWMREWCGDWWWECGVLRGCWW